MEALMEQGLEVGWILSFSCQSWLLRRLQTGFQSTRGKGISEQALWGLGLIKSLLVISLILRDRECIALTMRRYQTCQRDVELLNVLIKILEQLYIR